MKNSQASGKLERKIVEKNRRLHMKSLSSKLVSVIPSLHNEKAAMSQHDLLDQVTQYIKNLQDRIHQLKLKKDLVLRSSERRSEGSFRTEYFSQSIVQVRDFMNSGVEVVLATGLCSNFKLSGAIAILTEEGLDVEYAGFSIVSGGVFCTTHSQLASPRLGCDCERMWERLKLLVQ